MTRKTLLVFLVFIVVENFTFAQNRPKTILWEIYGNGLHQKSYLLGTNHFFDETWIDSFTVIKEKFLNAKAIVGEMGHPDINEIIKAKIDTNHLSFDKLFTHDDYVIVNNYLIKKGLSSLDKAPNNFQSILGLFYATYVESLGLNKTGDKNSIDIYIENTGKKNHLFTALDSGITKIKTDSISLINEKTLSYLIVWTIKNENSKSNSLDLVRNALKPGLDEFRNLTVNYKLTESMPDQSGQLNRELLLNRNIYWLKRLPAILKSNPCFIAVGLDHLKYKEGLISQLRCVGYKVKPVKIKRR